MVDDFQLLVKGFLRHAQREPSPRAWLEDIHSKAITAVAAGDKFVAMTAFDGTSSTIERSFPSQNLLAVTETALAHLDAEVAGDEISGLVTIGDFSCRRSEWG